MVAEVLVHRGDRVAAGDVIARLNTDVDDITLSLARARATDRSGVEARIARLEFLEQQAARLTELAEREAVSTAMRDEAVSEATVARSELAQARAELEIAKLEAEREAALLAQKTLRSPVAGIVTEQLLSPGEYRDGQDHIATIAKMDRLKVEAFAPLGHFGQIELGQVVTIRPEDPVGGAYPATVTVIDRVFDAATATFGLEMVIDNTEANLPAGLRCAIDF